MHTKTSWGGENPATKRSCWRWRRKGNSIRVSWGFWGLTHSSPSSTFGTEQTGGFVCWSNILKNSKYSTMISEKIPTQPGHLPTRLRSTHRYTPGGRGAKPSSQLACWSHFNCTVNFGRPDSSWNLGGRRFRELTFLSGFWISGRMTQKGLMTSRNLTLMGETKAELGHVKNLPRSLGEALRPPWAGAGTRGADRARGLAGTPGRAGAPATV